jgi:hypothetical protein
MQINDCGSLLYVSTDDCNIVKDLDPSMCAPRLGTGLP